jgi:hypothetical protein
MEMEMEGPDDME